MIHPRIIDKPLGAIIAKLPRRVTPLMSAASFIASPPIVAVVLLWVIALSAAADNDRLFQSGLIALLLSPVAELSKLITRRHRPETLYAQNMRFKTYSFPSGHSYISALVFGFLAIAAAAWLPFGWLIAAALVALIFLVGVSRVYLGAHFPSDVVAGWTLGAAAQYLVWLKAGL